MIFNICCIGLICILSALYRFPLRNQSQKSEACGCDSINLGWMNEKNKHGQKIIYQGFSRWVAWQTLGILLLSSLEGCCTHFQAILFLTGLLDCSNWS